MARDKGRKRAKTAIVAAKASPRKQPVWQGPRTHHNQRLSWRFSAADTDGPFAWRKIGDDRLREVHDRLCEWERLEMPDLLRRRHCYTDLSVLSAGAKQRLQEIELDDLDCLYSFRVTKQARLWCMDAPDEGVMFVLWWDPGHIVYPSGR